MRDFQPGHDELVVAVPVPAAPLIVGKTNVPEFANDGYTANPLFGATGQPLEPVAPPGGSQRRRGGRGGRRIGPLAIAQDGGGSIRRPASHTGLVAEAFAQRLARRAHAAGALAGLRLHRPVARTVADVRLLFRRAARAGSRRPFVAGRSNMHGQPRPQAPLRVLYVEHLYDNPLDRRSPTAAGAPCTSSKRWATRRARLTAIGRRFVLEAWSHIGQVGLATCSSSIPTGRRAASAKYRDAAEVGRRVPAARIWQVSERVRRLRSECVRCSSAST